MSNFFYHLPRLNIFIFFQFLRLSFFLTFLDSFVGTTFRENGTEFAVPCERDSFGVSINSVDNVGILSALFHMACLLVRNFDNRCRNFFYKILNSKVPFWKIKFHEFWNFKCWSEVIYLQNSKIYDKIWIEFKILNS